MNEKEWRSIGFNCRQIHRLINETLVLAQHLLTVKDLQQLEKASHYVDRFRSKAEGVMFSSKGPQGFDVFYGENEK